MNIDAEKAAGMLVVGFVKTWTLREVLSAVLLCPTDIRKLDAESINAQAPFLPANKFEYMGDVRTYVVNHFPRLGAFLLNNSGNAEKCLSVVPEIMKLKYKFKETRRQNKDDIAEHKKINRKAKHIQFSYHASRNAFKSNQRSAWDVCKK